MTLVELLREVLASPTNHTGVRCPDGIRAHRYTAKRLDDDLLRQIREAIDNNEEPF